MLDSTELYGRWREVVPDLETITLQSRQPGAAQGTFKEYTLTSHREKLSTKDVELLGGALASQDYLWWEIWTEWLDTASAVSPAELPCPEPKEGDIVVDADGVGYVIKTIENKLMRNVRKCLALRKMGA